MQRNIKKIHKNTTPFGSLHISVDKPLTETRNATYEIFNKPHHSTTKVIYR